MIRFFTVLLIFIALFGCKRSEPQPDPRNTCGPKVPFEECIK